MLESDDSLPQSDANWFRAPTMREHVIAAALFVGFGIFFALLFLVLSGWWFRWVILGIAVVSMLHGLGHGRDAVRKRVE